MLGVMNNYDISRRLFLGGAAFAGTRNFTARAAELPKDLAPAIEKIEPYFTAPSKFQDVSRGNPIPHTLPEAKRREVGLTRETWFLEVLSDSDNPCTLGKTFTKANNTALTFDDLLKLGEKKSVRFAKVMTCLNIGCPLGMGIWEGVPLRVVLWMTQPKENLRRVFYHGYHNDDPKQIFQSSLPAGRVLLGGAAAGAAGGRVQVALPHHRRERACPTDAPPVQEVRPLRHRDREPHRRRVSLGAPDFFGERRGLPPPA